MLRLFPAEISIHAALAETLSEQQLVYVDTVPQEDGRWKVTVVAYDYLGELSLICGLMFVYGLDIQAGEIFTYETVEKPPAESGSAATVSSLHYRPRKRGKAGVSESSPSTLDRRKIVDVFMVKSVRPEVPDAAFWANYTDDLHELLKMMHAGQRREARKQACHTCWRGFRGDRKPQHTALSDSNKHRQRLVRPIHCSAHRNRRYGWFSCTSSPMRFR